jgi:hypothetical protein
VHDLLRPCVVNTWLRTYHGEVCVPLILSLDLLTLG